MVKYRDNLELYFFVGKHFHSNLLLNVQFLKFLIPVYISGISCTSAGSANWVTFSQAVAVSPFSFFVSGSQWLANLNNAQYRSDLKLIVSYHLIFSRVSISADPVQWAHWSQTECPGVLGSHLLPTSQAYGGWQDPFPSAWSGTDSEQTAYGGKIKVRGRESWNLFSWKTRTSLSCTLNTLVADDQVTAGAIAFAPAAMVLEISMEMYSEEVCRR